MEQAQFFYNDAGEKLAGSLHLPESSGASPETAFVWGHCFTCSRHTGILRDISRTLAEKGFASLRFDFSGNGQSQGDFSATSYSKHIRETEQAMLFLEEKGFSRFFLGGHSMGAAIAVLTAAKQKKVKGVCALAGRLGSREGLQIFSQKQMRELEERGRLRFESRGRKLELDAAFFADMKQYDIPAAVKKLTVPLLVIHGDQDEIISVENARSAKEINAAVQVEIIAGADHMFLNAKHRADICTRVGKWVEKNF